MGPLEEVPQVPSLTGKSPSHTLLPWAFIHHVAWRRLPQPSNQRYTAVLVHQITLKYGLYSVYYQLKLPSLFAMCFLLLDILSLECKLLERRGHVSLYSCSLLQPQNLPRA